MMGQERLRRKGMGIAFVLAVVAASVAVAVLMACPVRSYASELEAATAGGVGTQALRAHVMPCTSGANAYFDTFGDDSGAVVTNVKSSNEEVASAYASGSSVCVCTHKKGSAKVSYKANGKKAAFNIVVRKWVNPVKSFKVGARDYAKNFKTDWPFFIGSTKKLLTGKVAIVPAAGWRLTSLMTHEHTQTGTFPQPYGADKTFKNGAKVKNKVWMLAFFKNERSGLEERIQLAAYPWGA